jgi:uncharacterized protein YecE (DUF72 family)
MGGFNLTECFHRHFSREVLRFDGGENGVSSSMQSRPKLKLWAERITSMAAEAEEIYVFFKHETSAPDRAFRLRALLSGAL